VLEVLGGGDQSLVPHQWCAVLRGENILTSAGWLRARAMLDVTGSAVLEEQEEVLARGLPNFWTHFPPPSLLCAELCPTPKFIW
jgi:hypothetical protein